MDRRTALKVVSGGPIGGGAGVAILTKRSLSLPVFKPDADVLDFISPVSACQSTLCHVSTTHGTKVSGFRAKSKERSERCRRLASDVAAKLATSLNPLVDGAYVTTEQDDEATRTCVTCHDQEGGSRQYEHEDGVCHVS